MIAQHTAKIQFQIVLLGGVLPFYRHPASLDGITILCRKQLLVFLSPSAAVLCTSKDVDDDGVLQSKEILVLDCVKKPQRLETLAEVVA